MSFLCENKLIFCHIIDSLLNVKLLLFPWRSFNLRNECFESLLGNQGSAWTFHLNCLYNLNNFFWNSSQTFVSLQLLSWMTLSVRSDTMLSFQVRQMMQKESDVPAHYVQSTCIDVQSASMCYYSTHMHRKFVWVIVLCADCPLALYPVKCSTKTCEHK